MKKLTTKEDLSEVKKKGLKKLFPDIPRVSVGLATCGIASGADEILEELKTYLDVKDVLITKTGCFGICNEEPIVNVKLPGKPIVLFKKINKENIKDVVNFIEKGKITRKNVLCKIEEWDHITTDEPFLYGRGFKNIPLWNEISFFKPQKKLVMRNAGIINPEDIEEYIAVGGYSALFKTLRELKPEQVIENVKQSGLRGRGGAGFPTGLKWDFVRKENSDIKYIICNADEGDPGAYMNRNEMESDPHMVIEGMIIGAYAMGAKEGYIYVRAEYPLAIERLSKAIEDARTYGLLGENIFGSDFSFDIHLAKGAGAFVCGEETALIASIEGKPGRPRLRPPFPAHKGLWGMPTNINNVETWCNIEPIVKKGGEWFSKIGIENNTGTKVYSLVGKVKKAGLVEVPLGTPINTIVYDIGEGGIKGRKVKAVQTGGPSGGCIPSPMFATPMDYDHLKEVGSIMGSGGIVVMDENTCMVDTAKYFLEFATDESCGKCTPGREGTYQMWKMLDKITKGNGTEQDLEFLENTAKIVKLTALCGLGQTAPNPVLTTIKYFKNEYIEHIKYKKCRAGVCENLVYAPCQNACPLGQDVPSYVAYIAHRKFDKALEVIMRTNPFPRILGRVCDRNCELHCRLSDSSEPIAIRDLKRFVADKVKTPRIEIREHKDKKVAVVGSGPAGLSAAYFLTLKGYDTTIFESQPYPGGMLRLGIPEFRLPRNVLDEEIKRMTSLGVDIKTNVAVGKDVTIPELFERGYESIFIGVGFQNGAKLNIPGEDADGVIDGVKFLRDIAMLNKISLGENVFVVGGGNVAMDVARDAARTAWRLKKDAKITIVYRRTRDEMPALSEEIEEALSEGIDIQFLTDPVRILTENGKIKAVEWVKMRLGETDKSGRRRPIPIKGSEFITPADNLIVAIGQTPDMSFLKDADELKTSGNTLVVDSDVLLTSMEGVFAGGDIVTGPTTVVEAAAAGKRAAESIDKYLRGIPLVSKHEVKFPTENVPVLAFSAEELEELSFQKRVKPTKIPISKRKGSFEEVEKTLTTEKAVREARRCLRCDVREEE